MIHPERAFLPLLTQVVLFVLEPSPTAQARHSEAMEML